MTKGEREVARWEVTLYRSNGRLVKSRTRPSSYSAKKLRAVWEDKYDESYYVEVQRID